MNCYFELEINVYFRNASLFSSYNLFNNHVSTDSNEMLFLRKLNIEVEVYAPIEIIINRRTLD